MFLKELELKDFRNYKHEKIEFCEGANIIAGLNAQGKTNVLEAINIVSTGRSHRTRKDLEMIRWDEEISEIKGSIEDEYRGLIEVEYRFNREKKKYLSINGVKLDKISGILGNLHTVIFSPDHLAIVKEGPSERRKFLDLLLSQLKPSYYHALSNYSKVLDFRNKTLFDIREDEKKKTLLDVWDEQLVRYGMVLFHERKLMVRELDEKAKKICDEISGNHDHLKLKYSPSIFEKSLKDDTIEGGEKFLAELFFDKLRDNRINDIRKGHTSVGPHRDDFELLINEKEVRNYGSQGQQRTVLLALKIAELQIMADFSGSDPVLLLDDVFSELDSNRKEFLLKYLRGIQSIITCTDADVITGLRDVESIRYFKVEEGTIEESNFEEINNVVCKR